MHNLDDDMMIKAMMDENITQFGKDVYKTYREGVTAAVEQLAIKSRAPNGANAKNDARRSKQN